MDSGSSPRYGRNDEFGGSSDFFGSRTIKNSTDSAMSRDE